MSPDNDASEFILFKPKNGSSDNTKSHRKVTKIDDNKSKIKVSENYNSVQ